MESSTPPPPFNHDLTCYHNYEGDEGEESDEDKDRGGLRCQGKGQIYGGEDKGGKND